MLNQALFYVLEGSDCPRRIIIFMPLSVISSTTSTVLGVIYISPRSPRGPYTCSCIELVTKIFGRALEVPNLTLSTSIVSPVMSPYKLR